MSDTKMVNVNWLWLEWCLYIYEKFNVHEPTQCALYIKKKNEKYSKLSVTRFEEWDKSLFKLHFFTRKNLFA